MRIIALLLLSCVCAPAKNKVLFFNIDRRAESVEVVLDAYPTGAYADPSQYHLVASRSGLPGEGLHWIDLARVIVSPASTIVTVLLKNPQEIRETTQVLLMVGDEPAVAESRYPAVNASRTDTKPSKETSDIYLNGIYSPGIHSPPQYTIDASLGALFNLPGKADYGSLGFLGTAQSDKRPTADPDSFRIFGVYQRALTKHSHWPLEGALLTWLFAGAEFDRKANNINVISSPLLDFPIRLRGRINSQKQVVPVLTPEIGMEAGENLANAISPHGGGAIARGVLGASLSVDFKPKLKLFQQIHLASNYKVRLPAEPQVFTLTMLSAGKVIDVPSLSTRARQYVKNEIDFGLWKPISFAITHEYGSLPPAFRWVDNKVTIGFTFASEVKSSLQGELRGK